jgi:hypothetical protein
MVKKTIDFFQIYYKEDHLKRLYSFAKPFYNQTLTPYFENSVIASLVPTSNADLISVASWRLKQKRKSISSSRILKAVGGIELTLERMLTNEFDVAILTPRVSEHKMLFMANHWHGKVWTDSFMLLSSFLRDNLGIEMPEELAHPIYGNHFVAKKYIYHNYVRSCLIPTINFMKNSENIFMQGTGYRAIKENSGDFETIADYEVASGARDWPIGVFLLERLFSIWVNDKGFHVVNL